jgi:hypothetical protein
MCHAHAAAAVVIGAAGRWVALLLLLLLLQLVVLLLLVLLRPCELLVPNGTSPQLTQFFCPLSVKNHSSTWRVGRTITSADSGLTGRDRTCVAAGALQFLRCPRRHAGV